MSDAHGSVVDPLDHLRSDSHTPSAHGLSVGHPGQANAGELAVDDLGAHLPLKYRVAPVARMLENEQADDDFGGKAAPTACAAQGTTLGESLIGGHHDRIICQHRISVNHPVLVEAVDLLGDQPVPEG